MFSGEVDDGGDGGAQLSDQGGQEGQRDQSVEEADQSDTWLGGGQVAVPDGCRETAGRFQLI